MEASDGSSLQSVCMIRAAELFPKPTIEKEDAQLAVPYQELPGEAVKYLGRTDDGLLALSNYRLFVLSNATRLETSIPLGLIETAQSRDLFHLIVQCKDASTVKCSFETAEQCADWQRHIQNAVAIPETLESLFAFAFYAWTSESLSSQAAASNGPTIVSNSNDATVMGVLPSNLGILGFAMAEHAAAERLQRDVRYDADFMAEVERLGFDLKSSWRISEANQDFKLCASYPKRILVPCCISDETLTSVANFRGSRRLPAVVWRHRKSGAVIARCSQPEVGWLGWRNAKDEQLLQALADACAFDRGEQMRLLQQLTGPGINNSSANNSDDVATTTETTTTATTMQATHNSTTNSNNTPAATPDDSSSQEEVAMDDIRKILIVDARSYTSAVTNRARGGGCECIEYYPCAEIEFMNLGNIHVIRKSFQALRQLCASPPDMPNWLGLLEKTMWLQHLCGLLSATTTVCHAIEKKGRPVLVHCSDGWDRTPQIVATAQLCLDPYYRTVEGFRILVEKEWLSYGHKFSDRCGNGPGADETNERCPVFLQWLDVVHQIHRQYPCYFEFSMGYLIKLAQHSLSCLFGTFFCNTLKERLEHTVFERTFSVWPFLSGPQYRNPLYVPNREKVLWPKHNVRDLSLWNEVYLSSLGNQHCVADFNDDAHPISNGEDGGCGGGVGDVGGSGSGGGGVVVVSHDNDDENIDCALNKTRSYGDLMTAGLLLNGMASRRSSDPNVTMDANLSNNDVHSENNSALDTQSETEDMPLGMDGIDIGERPTTMAYNNTNGNNTVVNDDLLERTSSMTLTDTSQPNHVAAHTINNRSDQQQLAINGDADGDAKSSNCLSSTLPMETTTTQSSTTANTQSSIQSSAIQSPQPATTINGSRSIPQNNEMKQSVTTSPDIKSITIHKLTDNGSSIHLDLLRNVSNDDDENDVDVDNDHCDDTHNRIFNSNAIDSYQQQQQLWHGSIQSSTDTLVPITETKTTTSTITDADENGVMNHNNQLNQIDDVDSIGRTTMKILNGNDASTDSKRNLNANDRTNGTTTTTTQTTDDATSVATHIQNVTNSMSTSPPPTTTTTATNNDCASKQMPTAATTTTATTNELMESIIMLPEHQKLDISISGKCEMVPNSTQATNNADGCTNATTTTTALIDTTSTSTSSSSAAALTMYLMTQAQNSNTQQATTTGGGGGGGGSGSSGSRRRTSSSNSRRDGQYVKQISNQSTMSRFSLTGVRSLPMTPSGMQDRPQIAISCPDGLAHGLSEQNIRLQQLVHEHKLREDVLLREINAMRLTLLKKTCATCSNNGFAGMNDDEPCLAMDNMENASICSWEAVEDRSGPSSCTTTTTSSSIPQHSQHHQLLQQHQQQQQQFNGQQQQLHLQQQQQQQMNANNSVLWVPDHAVSRCTSCRTEFWLGRRKHHCRSCGQIFCADCSEFWAPLPEEKLLSPVRLCGPCYQSVCELPRSAFMHLEQQQQQHQQEQQQQHHHHHHHNNQQQQQQQHTSNVTTSKA